MDMNIPVILHIPHASTKIPPVVADQFILTPGELKHEINLLTDHATERIFTEAYPAAVSVVFPFSRLVVDPERFPDDSQEEMASVGMGVVYTHGSQRQPIRRLLTQAERRSLIEQYYKPHHAKLSAAVKQALKRHGKCLVLDCHSYPSEALPYELHHAARRPQVCLGTDDYHTPEMLVSNVERSLEAMGFDVARNEPFAGTLVPLEYFRKELRVTSLMIEVNRSLYMNDDFSPCHRHLRRVVEALSNLQETLVLILTRFRGHLNLTMKGVHDAKDEKTISTGVSRADGRAGSSRPYARGAVAGV